jgi:hypothetical protein
MSETKIPDGLPEKWRKVWVVITSEPDCERALSDQWFSQDFIDVLSDLAAATKEIERLKSLPLAESQWWEREKKEHSTMMAERDHARMLLMKAESKNKELEAEVADLKLFMNDLLGPTEVLPHIADAECDCDHSVGITCVGCGAKQTICDIKRRSSSPSGKDLMEILNRYKTALEDLERGPLQESMPWDTYVKLVVDNVLHPTPKEKVCPSCKDTKTVKEWTGNDHDYEDIECPVCKKKEEKVCRTCKGKGKIEMFRYQEGPEFENCPDCQKERKS